MTLREWLESDITSPSGYLHTGYINEMAVKLGILFNCEDQYDLAYKKYGEDTRGCRLERADDAIGSKVNLIVSMYASKFGIDSEIGGE